MIENWSVIAELLGSCIQSSWTIILQLPLRQTISHIASYIPFIFCCYDFSSTFWTTV